VEEVGDAFSGREVVLRAKRTTHGCLVPNQTHRGRMGFRACESPETVARGLVAPPAPLMQSKRVKNHPARIPRLHPRTVYIAGQ
jgi:hypothetical protein